MPVLTVLWLCPRSVEELIGGLVHAYGKLFWKDAALSSRICCMDSPRGKSGINLVTRGVTQV